MKGFIIQGGDFANGQFMHKHTDISKGANLSLFQEMAQVENLSMEGPLMVTPFAFATFENSFQMRTSY